MKGGGCEQEVKYDKQMNTIVKLIWKTLKRLMINTSQHSLVIVAKTQVSELDSISQLLVFIYIKVVQTVHILLGRIRLFQNYGDGKVL